MGDADHGAGIRHEQDRMVSGNPFTAFGRQGAMMSPGPPQIAVVVPAFNARDTIREALDSILAQSLPPREVVVVDDGSGDGTPELVRAAYPGVRLAVQRNAGPAAARNRGIGLTDAPWVAFLDGDDAWYPWRLEVQAALAARNPDIGLWCGTAERWDGAGGAPLPPPPRTDAVAHRRIGVGDLLANNAVATSSVLARRSVLDGAGGFDPAFRGPEDLDLWLRVAARAPVAFLDAPVCRYRVRPGSLSLDERRFLPEVMRVLDKAFGPGGAASGLADLEPLARSTQYWNASWMAFSRGARAAALAYWWRAWRLDRCAPRRVPRRWLPLLARYAVGARGEKGMGIP